MAVPLGKLSPDAVDSLDIRVFTSSDHPRVALRHLLWPS